MLPAVLPVHVPVAQHALAVLLLAVVFFFYDECCLANEPHPVLVMLLRKYLILALGVLFEHVVLPATCFFVIIFFSHRIVRRIELHISNYAFKQF
jgi:hypothetical protein